MATTDVLSRYDIDQTISIFKNDLEFQSVVIEKNGIVLADPQYRNLAILLLSNKDYIGTYNIEELNSQEPPFLRDEISAIYNKSFIGQDVYRQTMYTFKYSTIKIFFRSNYKYFMPDYDYLNIQSSEKMRIFQEAFMREYDRFSSIIDNIYNIPDIDKVPNEYLNYIAQTIGYEREDSDLLGDASFRELIKNIIEIYRIKGTNYSFELFFNFLGFEATLQEFWFDKRFSDPNLNNNPYTGSTDPKTYSYYMTPYKPTDYIPVGMRYPYIVTDNKIVATQDCNMFSLWATNGTYTTSQLLGDSVGFPGTPFTFFKTNVMQYNLASIKTTSTQQAELTTEELLTIKRYADFLTPIFISKNVIVSITPYEESAITELNLSDFNRPDPLSSNYLNNNSATADDVNDESFFHLYQGYQPKHYYWNDGVRLSEDPVPAPSATSPRWSGSSIEPRGHFISGYYNDTYNKVWNRTYNSKSVYDKVSQDNPGWGSEQVLEYISSLIHNRTIFSSYGVKDRDLFYPFIDADGNFYYPAISFNKYDDFSVGTPLKLGANFSLLKGANLRLSDAQNPEDFPNLYNDSEIISIVADNGSGQAEIKVDDNDRKFQFLSNLGLGPQENRLYGTFVFGSTWVTNVEYNTTIAPNWTPAVYTLGQYRRDSGKVFLCITSYDASFDTTISDNGHISNWQLVKGIDLIKVGMKFYDKILFGYEIIDVDSENKQFKISRNSTITGTNTSFTVYSDAYTFITLKNTYDFNNEGNYKVVSSSSITSSQTIAGRVVYNTITTLTLNTILNKDQPYNGGFVSLYYEPWRLKNFRFPFMFNRIKMTSEFFGTSLTSWLDEMYSYYETGISFSGTNLNIQDSQPFNIIGVNYSEYPYGNAYKTELVATQGLVPTIRDSFFVYIEYYLGMYSTFNYSYSYNWKVPNNLYNYALQQFKVAGIYNSGSFIKSSYKFNIENPTFYQDYMEVM